jgi:hypothetical protein
MKTTPALGPRELNRATLARQLLLRRATMDPAAMWARLDGSDPEDFSRRSEAGTDILALRGHFQNLLETALRSPFGRRLPGLDTDAVLSRAPELLAAAGAGAPTHDGHRTLTCPEPAGQGRHPGSRPARATARSRAEAVVGTGTTGPNRPGVPLPPVSSADCSRKTSTASAVAASSA